MKCQIYVINIALIFTGRNLNLSMIYRGYIKLSDNGPGLTRADTEPEKCSYVSENHKTRLRFTQTPPHVCTSRIISE